MTGKVAERYFETSPWQVSESGFDPAHGRVGESIFSLANEYMGIRGYFDEGYSGDQLPGMYLNGVFEEARDTGPHYRGVSTRTTAMAPAVDWLFTRLSLDGERLDLARSAYAAFTRTLDMRTGVLRRDFIWKTASGKQLRLGFRRLLSMTDPHLGAQQVVFEALNFSGPVEVTAGMDFSLIHKSRRKRLFRVRRQGEEGEIMAMLGRARLSRHAVFAGCLLRVPAGSSREVASEPWSLSRRFGLDLRAGQPLSFEKLVYLHADTRPSASDDVVWADGLRGASCLAGLSFAQLQGENEAYWQAFWKRFDLEIDDDLENLQGIRYCMFQLNQTYHGTEAGLNIGAKGLTGEAYNGHAFWDSETYCLPYYLFTNPDAARQLLEYRHATLPQALARAQALDCTGACYPIATVDGTECCTLWQHASLQLQPSTGVAYGVRHYCTVTGDRAFLYRQGVEMLVQICRFLASRGQWGPRTGEFGYFGVMGPDEFQMMVNNNAYTNFMARETFDYTLTVLSEMRVQAAPALAALTERLALLPAELEAWSLMARSMRMPLDAATGIYEQHDGYFDLPHIDIQTIPRREFPLYNHWSYDRLFRNDMVKQPDVLMFLFLHNQQFSFETKMVNYEYYEPRCIHESSLSPSLHSVLASELGKSAEAYEFFRFATRLDLDDYNRNTSEGLHITSLAAAWITIVYGFGGMRSDGPILAFRPSLPAAWRHYGFRVLYRKAVIGVSVSPAGAAFRLLEGEPVTVLIYGEETKLGSEEIVVPRSGDAAGPRPQVPAALPS